MNILLVNPNFNAETLTYSRMSGLPLGILSIGTYLKNNGHRIRIIDRFFDDTPFEVLLNNYRPDIVGISLMSNTTILDAVAVADFFRSRNIPVVMGGTYASIVPEMLINEKKADYVIVGEGEQIWLELADSIENGKPVENIRGIYYAGSDGRPLHTGEHEFMDLALLGPCDFSLLENIPAYFQTSYCYDKMLYLYMSKGCTGNCSFCFNHFFHRCTLRRRPVSHLVDEIECLMRDHGLKTVYFADELWGLYADDRETFFAELETRKLKFIWGCQTRIGVLKREDMQKMYDHGCRWIMFGIEAPPGRLAETANKKLPYALIEPTLKDCSEIGIITNISFIINYPHSTEQDLKDTVSFALSLSPTFYSIHYFYPLEKSLLYEQVVREGLFTPPGTLSEAAHRVMSEFIVSEFSEVPDIDFKVVRSCFLVQSLLSKTPVSDDGASSFALEAVKSVFLNVRSQSFFKWVNGLWHTAMYFFDVTGTVILHSRIRKKYGFKFKLRKK